MADTVADGSPEPETDEGADERSYVLSHREAIAEADRVPHRGPQCHPDGPAVPEADFVPDSGAYDPAVARAHHETDGGAHVLPDHAPDITADAGALAAAQRVAHTGAFGLAHGHPQRTADALPVRAPDAHAVVRADVFAQPEPNVAALAAADARAHHERSLAAAQRVAHQLLRVPRDRLRLLQLRRKPDVLAYPGPCERRHVRRQPDLPADDRRRRRRRRRRLQEGRGPHGQRLAARRAPTPPPSFPLSFLGRPF